ncbi:MAG: polysaccharide lyase [Lentisphaerae bacterium]|nr:polysaccharide lyase [Lentisphaerota bacterium]
MRKILLAASVALAGVCGAAEGPTRDEAAAALRRGVAFFREKVAVEGSYLWAYSEDLSRREGEGVARATVGWVQPPGTPSVGSVMLEAWEATGDRFHLDAALETAQSLVRGQLASGGWDYSIEFDPARRKKLPYRADGGTAGKNVSTLDDDTTQAAVRFLLRADRACAFTNEAIHRCVTTALGSLLAAQYPNGAWPQRFEAPPDASKFPVKAASYPDAWSRTFPGRDYKADYTFNDNALADMIDTMFEASLVLSSASADGAAQALGRACRAAAEKAGGFILLAQMPDPQPAWAQQYDADMHPAWARKFEPPSITGGESQGILRILMRLHRETGDRRFLEPVPRALAYLRRSLLPNGQLARFHELKTNTPLYFTKDYRLVYDDGDLPTHYAFKVSSDLDSIARQYEQAAREPWKAPAGGPRIPTLDGGTRKAAAGAIAAQDAEGRWVEKGGLKYQEPKDASARVIRCDAFVRHVRALSRFIAASKAAP